MSDGPEAAGAALGVSSQPDVLLSWTPAVRGHTVAASPHGRVGCHRHWGDEIWKRRGLVKLHRERQKREGTGWGGGDRETEMETPRETGRERVGGKVRESGELRRP